MLPESHTDPEHSRPAHDPAAEVRQRQHNLLAWVLAVLLGPSFTIGSLLTLLRPGIGPLVVLIGATAGMAACLAAAVHLVDGGPAGPHRRDDGPGTHRRGDDPFEGW